MKHWTFHILWGALGTLPVCFASPPWLPFVFTVIWWLPFGVVREMWQGMQLPWEFSKHRWLEATGWAMGSLATAALSLIWLT